MKVAVFRDELAHTNTSNSPSPPLAGGGEMAVGSFPPPPPGRVYRLVELPSGGCQVILASSTGPTARTTDCSSLLARMNATNRRAWGQSPLPGPTR